MAYSSELFHGSHDTDMFVQDEQTVHETAEHNDETVTASLGAAAMSDIEREWGPARRRPDAPRYEADIPAGLTWSA